MTDAGIGRMTVDPVFGGLGHMGSLFLFVVASFTWNLEAIKEKMLSGERLEPPRAIDH